MPLPETSRSIDHRSVELDGVRYVILRESIFRDALPAGWRRGGSSPV